MLASGQPKDILSKLLREIISGHRCWEIPDPKTVRINAVLVQTFLAVPGFTVTVTVIPSEQGNNATERPTVDERLSHAMLVDRSPVHVVVNKTRPSLPCVQNPIVIRLDLSKRSKSLISEIVPILRSIGKVSS